MTTWFVIAVLIAATGAAMAFFLLDSRATATPARPATFADYLTYLDEHPDQWTLRRGSAPVWTGPRHMLLGEETRVIRPLGDIAGDVSDDEVIW